MGVRSPNQITAWQPAAQAAGGNLSVIELLCPLVGTTSGTDCATVILMLMRLLLSLLVCLAPFGVRGVETWQSALSRMPLNTHVTRLVRTNCVQVMLNSFQSNDVVKA